MPLRTYHAGGSHEHHHAPCPGRTSARTAEQAWAYPLLIALLAVSLGVSGAPAPLYGLYAERWGLAPITTTLVFAVYAIGALGAVLLAGQASDRFGRKPLLVGAAVGMLVGLVVFMTASGLRRALRRPVHPRPRPSAPRSSSAAPRCSTCDPSAAPGPAT